MDPIADPGKGLSAPRPFRDTEVPEGLRIPGWMLGLLAAGTAIGPAVALARSPQPFSRGLLRSIFLGSTFAYLVTAADLAEHLRLEKQVTGRRLRWTVVPPSETLTHAAIIGTNLATLVLSRPLRRRPTLRDRWLTVAPAAFLVLGCLDEVVFHRRRTLHREDVLHAVQHLAEGIMWTTLYATRVFAR